jgi:effector-binding domain-containing protein
MRRFALNVTLILLTSIVSRSAMATEEAKYQVVSKTGNFEIRDYAPQVVAETVVNGTREEAGNKAFNRLFGYISGKNQSSGKIAMTAPVSQIPASEKISMTAPVGQQQVEGGWVVSFTMPASYTLETLPAPTDSTVKLRLIPACRMAVVRYSGRWSQEHYSRYEAELKKWVSENGLKILGEPVWARYNAPFTPWFLRRNEILIPIEPRTK